MTEPTYSLHQIKCTYLNNACNLMESYFSDLVYDLISIENMKVNDTYYFIVQPHCTHIVFSQNNYYDTCDGCARCWGNYVVYKIKRIDENSFVFWNWDKLETMSLDTKNENLIKRYKEWKLKKELNF